MSSSSVVAKTLTLSLGAASKNCGKIQGGGMTVERTKSPYCQSCIRLLTRGELTRCSIGGRMFWFCQRCIEPIPQAAYRMDGAEKHLIRAFRPNLRRVTKHKGG